MQRHHPNRRQSRHQLDNKYQQHLQPRQRSRRHRHGRAGYNNQPTQRRPDAAGKRSTTGTAKGDLDEDSKTNISQPLISIHAEQKSRASDGAAHTSIRTAPQQSVQDFRTSRAFARNSGQARADCGFITITNRRYIDINYLQQSRRLHLFPARHPRPPRRPSLHPRAIQGPFAPRGGQTGPVPPQPSSAT